MLFDQGFLLPRQVTPWNSGLPALFCTYLPVSTTGALHSAGPKGFV